MMTEPQLKALSPQDIEASFRSSIEDVVDILKKMVPYYERTDEVIESLEGSLQNDGLLRLLMDRVLKKRR